MPDVVHAAWSSVNGSYNLGPLDGPRLDKVLTKVARKWSATAQKADDLIAVDIYVLNSNGIPGLDEYISDGRTIYYPSGLSVLEGAVYRELLEREVEALRPPTALKVVVESLGGEKISGSIGYYRNNREDAIKLAGDISQALDKLGVPKSKQ